MRWLLALLLAVAAAPAAAHPAPFSYLDLRLMPSGSAGALVLHDYDVAHELGIAPPEELQEPDRAVVHRDRILRLVSQRMTLSTPGGQPLRITWGALAVLPERQSVSLAFTIDGPRPAAVAIDALLFPYDPVHQTFVNVYEDGQLRHQAILDARRPQVTYYTGSAQGALAVVRVFIPAGIEHILIGPDHVLFLIGLMLLGGSAWRLAAIVTAFTVGHSITLSLAALDVVTLPARIVEPAIALSIVFIGADNLLMMRKDQGAGSGEPGTGTVRVPDQAEGRDIRAWVAGAFGLIHGFGFASVLREFGLPQTALGWSLFSFNAGVELGQLIIVAASAGLLLLVRSRSSRMADHLVMAGSIGVILAGGYWFVERVFLTGGV